MVRSRILDFGLLIEKTMRVGQRAWGKGQSARSMGQRAERKEHGAKGVPR
jgi:hypothetical protein